MVQCQIGKKPLPEPEVSYFTDAYMYVTYINQLFIAKQM